MTMYASLTENRTMTYEEVMSHSLPFLSAVNYEIMRLRIIEAGGNPDKEDDGTETTASSYDETESTMSTDDFFAAVNGLFD